MKKPSDLDNEVADNLFKRQSSNHSSWRRKLLRGSVVLLLSGVSGGLTYGWFWLQRKLVPLIETELTDYFQRPVEIGQLTRLSPTGARFGESAIPPTDANPDKVSVEAVEVNFNLWQLLQQQSLQLNLTLIKPNLYIEQNQKGVWTPTDFGSEGQSEGFKVDVEQIHLKQAQITLAAWNKSSNQLNPTVTGEIDRATVNLLNDGEIIQFQAAGELIKGGEFTIEGNAIPDTEDINLNVVGKQLAAAEIDNLLSLPLDLHSGRIRGNLAVQLNKDPITLLNGTADLDQVTAQIPELAKPFSNSNGKLSFDGSEITLEGIETAFGEIGAIATGSIDTAGEGEYRLKAKTQPAEVNQIVAALELEPPPIPIKGKLKSDITVSGSLVDPITKLAVVNTTPSQIDRVNWKNFNADLELRGTNLEVQQFQAVPQMGGVVSGTGNIDLSETQNLWFNVQAQNVPGDKLARAYNSDLPVEISSISGKAKISAQADNLASFQVNDATASFPLGGGTVTVNNLNYSNGNWQSQLQAKAVEFASLPLGKDSPSTIGAGKLDGQFQVRGQAETFDLTTIRAEGKASLQTVGGEIDVSQLKLANGSWVADVAAQQLQMRQLFPEIPPEFITPVSGQLNLTGTIPSGSEAEKIEGFGSLALADGEVEVSDLDINGNDWNATIEASQLELDQLNSAIPTEFAGLVNGNFDLKGTIDNITPAGIEAKGDGSLTLPEGVFDATDLALANGNFQTLIIPQGVDLSLFADPNSDDLELKGKLGGQLHVTGALEQITPSAVAAKGQVTFSQGIDLIEQPFTAAVNWNGRRLEVLQATGDGLSATGWVELDKSFFEAIPDKLAAVDYFQFAVDKAQWLDIRKLRLTLPPWATNLDYSGRADFRGQISGIPAAMAIDGDLVVRDLVVENLRFAPMLEGEVTVAPQQGVDLQLARDRDRIELVLDQNYLPISFLLEREEFAVTGEGAGEILQITTTDFPVSLLKTIAVKSDDFTIPETVAAQTFSGELSGKFIVNLNTLATSGKNIVITSPVLGRIKGDRLTGNFQYADGYFDLQQGEFQQRDSIYQLKGNLIQKPDDLEIQGEVKVEQGQIQDVLVTLEVFELSDLAQEWGDRNYATAKDLYSPPTKEKPFPPLFSVGLPNAPVETQLRRLAEIQTLLSLEGKRRENGSLLPDISALQGTFNGSINVVGSASQGVAAEFDFQGEQWRWDEFTAREIKVAGNFEDNILTLLPVMIRADDSFIAFSGSLGGETQSGQLRLIDVPFELIEKFVSLPPEVSFGGLINASAVIAGSQANPQARGEITVADATINQTSVQSTQGSFNYDDARLNFFASSVVAENAEPLTVTGSIAYKLPFAQVKPDSDRLNLNLNVRNEGLALLNILSREEINWLDGQGDISLEVSGIFDQQLNRPRKLVANGKATVNQGKIAARALPDALLTEVEGTVLFDFDRIAVESLQGNFGGGKIWAIGTLPLNQSRPQTNPLTIQLDDLAIDLKGLYEGGVKGQLQIEGNALEPDIAGKLTLFDGTVLLAETTTNSENLDVDEEGLAAVTEYKNLQLKLGDNIQISQPPIFSFGATGDFKVNGTFNQPLPEGTITLERGQVNLFTTQLSLASGNNNTARFTRSNGLNPNLDIRLVGSAVETTPSPIPSDPLSSEINDISADSFGTLQTVRISARVKGLASQLTNNIELTSSPPRSQTEILALLGGSFVDTLGRGDSTLGLANLAGSALFGSFNNVLSDAFGLSEFRLFPTQIIDEDRERDRIIGLAGEAAIDITDNLSFSVLRILNLDIPAQFGVRYRLNDNFILRGSTNFDDESRTQVEYELRF